MNYFCHKRILSLLLLFCLYPIRGYGQGKNDYVAKEMIDFDKAIGEALDFAEIEGHTLVIVRADHETGGMSILGGDFQQGTQTAHFNTTDHSGVMVPVFAFGQGAELFQGVQENTDLFFKMMRLFGISSVAK